MNLSKINCPNCGDHYFYEKFWGVCARLKNEMPVNVCYCRCLNCESWFSFKVQNDQLVEDSYILEDNEIMHEIEMNIKSNGDPNE